VAAGDLRCCEVDRPVPPDGRCVRQLRLVSAGDDEQRHRDPAPRGTVFGVVLVVVAP
jgi:hypothetical protein